MSLHGLFPARPSSLRAAQTPTARVRDGLLVFLHRDSSKVSPKPPGLASPVLALGTLGLLALGARDVCLAPWSELALAYAFSATFAPLPADLELDLPSSSLDLVRVETLPALPSSSSLDLVRVEAPRLPSSSLHMRLVGLWPGLTLPMDGPPKPKPKSSGKKNASAGRGLAAVTASITAEDTTAALRVGIRMGTSFVGMDGFTLAISSTATCLSWGAVCRTMVSADVMAITKLSRPM